MGAQRKRILINALHTVTGGGLTYLAGILPELARDARFEWLLLAPEETLARLHVPAGVEVKVAPRLGFWGGHFYEQLKLPFLCVGWGVKGTLCNANYVPLLCERPMPIIHTTSKAAEQAVGWRMKVYWKVLKALTTVSVWTSPVVFAVARHVAAEYATNRWLMKKVRVASPGVEVVAKAERDMDLVVSVGDFYAQKDYPTLVRAFALLRERRPKVRLMIVGRPVEAQVRDEILRLVRELKVADAVTLTGAVPHERLMQTLAKAGVFVSTSKAETVQLPLLEAMAAGVPVVAGEAPHTLEFVGEAGVLVPTAKGGDIAAAFAVAMYGVLENRVIAEALAKKGLTRVKEMTWARAATVILSAL